MTPAAGLPVTAPLYTERLVDALGYAALVHVTQVRKGSEVPYLAHLLGVCSLVLEAGADEDVAVAGLLHDAVEDQGGAARAAEIEARFGLRVASIVADCTDADVVPKPPWRERKIAHLAHLETVGEDARLVALCDKLHNARSVLADLGALGMPVFERFKGGVDGTLWYYRAMLELFERRLLRCVHLPALREVVGDIERCVERSRA